MILDGVNGEIGAMVEGVRGELIGMIKGLWKVEPDGIMSAWIDLSEDGCRSREK
ncbi:hypothetical protein [Paenibacillus xylanexedens]|uniref:hypothetical protein n=1 Tax=Paenibacillus xylanexedens TaxID=528191 RepID=UPI001C92CE49|nr:hypothetical protein [Paenibacillus xylanexedens]